MCELLLPVLKVHQFKKEVLVSLETYFSTANSLSSCQQVLKLTELYGNFKLTNQRVFMCRSNTKKFRGAEKCLRNCLNCSIASLRINDGDTILKRYKCSSRFASKLRFSCLRFKVKGGICKKTRKYFNRWSAAARCYMLQKLFEVPDLFHLAFNDHCAINVKLSKQKIRLHGYKSNINISTNSHSDSSHSKNGHSFIRMKRSFSYPNILSSSCSSLRTASSLSDIRCSLEPDSGYLQSLSNSNVLSATDICDEFETCTTISELCSPENDNSEIIDKSELNAVEEDSGSTIPIESAPRKTQHSRSKSDGTGVLYSPSKDTDDNSETSFYKSLPSIFLEPAQKEKSIFEGSPFILPTECFFPRPEPGQTLTSFLSSDFNICAELDRENAHFCISEALISAMEQIKCTKLMKYVEEEMESDEEIKKLSQRIRIRRREKFREKAMRSRALQSDKSETTASPSASPMSSHSSDFGTAESMDSDEDGVEDLELSDKTQSNLSSVKESGLSLSMASMYSDADLHKMSSYTQAVACTDDRRGEVNANSVHRSAEAVALSLLSRFSEKQLPKASDLEWLVSEQDAPQGLLPLPDSWPVSPDEIDEVHGLGKTRLRGNLEWAPPRRQIIFSIHPEPKRKEAIIKQNFRCAGCGMKIERRCAKKFRYCDYLNRFFCQCCHANDLTYIPARILWKWDFRKYYVSKFAYNLLDQMYCDPLFNVVDVNSPLYQKARQLALCREYRIQIFYLMSFIKTCRNTEQIKKELDCLPEYILYDPHLYSIRDFIQVKKGELSKSLSVVVNRCVNHIMKCILCQGKGFICEVCNNEKDIIFPFQLNKVCQCDVCGSCFHKKCYKTEFCPKCDRIKERKKKLLENVASNDEL